MAYTSYFDRPHGHVTQHRSDAPDLQRQSSMASSRKRPRVEPHRSSQSGYRHQNHDLNASIISVDLASPPPLAHTDYILSGGLDTPGAWSEQRLERLNDVDAARDYRHSRFTPRSPELSFADLREKFGPLNAQNLDIPDEYRWGLRRTAWALTGGLAGKIITFCWNTTFRGFKAGGGQAYSDNAEAVRKEVKDHEFIRKRQNATARSTQQETAAERDGNNSTTLAPVYNFHSPNIEDSATKNNWVIVDHTASLTDECSPVRKRPRASLANTGIDRQINNPASRPTRPSQTASFASPRSRTASTTTLYNHPRPSSAASQRARPLLASPSRRQSSIFADQQQPQSPVSPEVEAYQRKKRRQEKKHDDSMRRLNNQLQDMIREGQQALGSKIEVYDTRYETDEGYYDDDHGFR